MFVRQRTVDRTELLHLEIILPLVAFSLPFVIAGPQWLTGTLVNSFLISYSLKFPKKNILPIIMLPSLGALAHGVLFGKFTPFLIFFLPFIWVGNAILMKSFVAFERRVGVTVAIGVSSLLKASALYMPAFLYFHLGIVPSMFLGSMGIIQLYTAILGGILAIGVIKLVKTSRE